MAIQSIECDEGYCSSSWEVDDDNAEPHYYYIAINDPRGRTTIQQVESIITDNKFYLSIYGPYVTQIPLDMIVIHKSYESSIEVGEKLDSDLTHLRLRFENRMLKIQSLNRENL